MTCVEAWLDVVAVGCLTVRRLSLPRAGPSHAPPSASAWLRLLAMARSFPLQSWPTCLL